MTVAGPLALSACGSAEQYNPPWLQSQQGAAPAPAPVPAQSAPSPKKPQTAAPVAPAATSQARTVTAGKNETLPALSRRVDVPSRFLIAENDLKSPYKLSEGQVLKVPAIRAHTVVAGETLTGIANRYGVDMTQLARINEIPAPYGVKVGQVLGIPLNEPKQPLPAAAREMAPTGQTATTQQQVQPSQPAPAEQTSPAAPDTQAASQASQPQAAPASSGTTAAATAATAAQSATATPAKAELSVEPPKRAGSLFGWPIKGKILTGFGVDAAGLRNDGINIQASPGSSVRAAENGVVVYAGNELKGFGNLLLIKHADGWMTAYAHNAELAVLRGDIVKKGQVIAKAGATGSVTSPQVHFEVRKDGTAVDPTQYMEKR